MANTKYFKKPLVEAVTVIGWEGYGAKRREDEMTISNSITKGLNYAKKEFGINFNFHEVWSSDRDCIEQVLRIISNTRTDDGLLMIQKSYAGPRSWKLLKKHHTLLSIFPKVVMIWIDPHGRLWFDGSMKPFGKRRMFIIPDNWIHDNMELFGAYQHRKWPHGGIPVAKGIQVINIPDTDHKHIVNHPKTLQMIVQGIHCFV